VADAPTIAELSGVTKRFGDTTAVDAVDLRIATGEFLAILGPSGCGKTTLLRMLAGFIVPDEGRISLAGADVTRVPPYRRDVNTVFQSYALFQHRTVAGNVAFGLQRKRVGRDEIRRRVAEALRLVHLEDRADAKPAELSGGQQQRVALARALVNMPSLLLLDEPLGALDLKLRREMQQELKTIHREVGLTFIFVTHDQEEAMTMSDRIVVMRDGQVHQIGTPAEIYHHPASDFVAGFVGTTNLLPGEMRADHVLVDSGLRVPQPGHGHAVGARVSLSIRPERLRLGSAVDDGCVSTAATVTDVVFLGPVTHLRLDIGNGHQLVGTVTSLNGSAPPQAGDVIDVGWRPEDSVVLVAGY
jgi:spermidine/putrescine transport system ATP-binding protein